MHDAERSAQMRQGAKGLCIAISKVLGWVFAVVGHSDQGRLRFQEVSTVARTYHYAHERFLRTRLAL